MFLGLQEHEILHWLNESDGEPLSDSENELVEPVTHSSGDSSSDDEENESDTVPIQDKNISSSEEDTASASTPVHPHIETTVGGRGRSRLRGSGETSVRGRRRGRGRGNSVSIATSRGRGGRKHAPVRCVPQRGRGRGRNVQQPRQRGIQFNQNWSGVSFKPNLNGLQQPAYLPCDRSKWEPVDFIKEYIDDDILDKMVTSTNRTALSRTGNPLGLTLKELKLFIGLNCIMSCLRYPKIRMYWSNRWRIPIIVRSMKRDRFFKIRRSLKVVYDDDLKSEEKKEDKMWKVRPLVDRILEGCHKQERTVDMSIDEMMIPFSGQCGMRVYLPSKPNPLGLKVLVLANPKGVVCDMIVYQGDTTFPNELKERYSLGECSIIFLTRTMVPGHIIHCDRYFTTLKLADSMLENGFYLVGTIMANRIPRHISLMSDKELMAKGRGTTFTLVREDGKLAITKWQDNKPVHLLSSCYAAEKTDTCQRWSKKKKVYETVTRPEVVKEYNLSMGGVDLADRMLSDCPSRARTKKWTVRVIFHMFDLAITNSWFVYRQECVRNGVARKNTMQLQEFKMVLGHYFIEANDVSSDSSETDDGVLEPKHKKRKVAIVPLPSKIRRTQKSDHMPIKTSVQNRCRLPGCKQKSRTKCSKCKIYLCNTLYRNCYQTFHK